VPHSQPSPQSDQEIVVSNGGSGGQPGVSTRVVAAVSGAMG
jgi:hypothetical protein